MPEIYVATASVPLTVQELMVLCMALTEHMESEKPMYGVSTLRDKLIEVLAKLMTQ